MARVFDLHVHTLNGSSDSCLHPKDLAYEARRVGLEGICTAEHAGLWDPGDLIRYSQEGKDKIVLLRGVESATDRGHILAYGVKSIPTVGVSARALCQAVRDMGGFTVAAHPFRRMFEPNPWATEKRLSSIEEAVSLPIFELVDAVEVLNGASSDLENLFAIVVAQRLGLKGTGGSDAHSHQGLGCYTTVFEEEVETEVDLLRQLKAGAFHCAWGLRNGFLETFDLAEADITTNPRFAEAIAHPRFAEAVAPYL